MMIILIVFIGVVLYYGFRGDGNIPVYHKTDANEILKERFVKGEIDETTYLSMKQMISK